MLETATRSLSPPEYPEILKEAIGEPLWSRIEEVSVTCFNPRGIEKYMTKHPLLKGVTEKGERFLACKYTYWIKKEGDKISGIFFLYANQSNEWIGKAPSTRKLSENISRVTSSVFISPALYFPKDWSKNPTELTQAVMKKMFNFEECGLYTRKVSVFNREPYDKPHEHKTLKFRLGIS